MNSLNSSLSFVHEVLTSDDVSRLREQSVVSEVKFRQRVEREERKKRENADADGFGTETKDWDFELR